MEPARAQVGPKFVQRDVDGLKVWVREEFEARQFNDWICPHCKWFARDDRMHCDRVKGALEGARDVGVIVSICGCAYFEQQGAPCSSA